MRSQQPQIYTCRTSYRAGDRVHLHGVGVAAFDAVVCRHGGDRREIGSYRVDANAEMPSTAEDDRVAQGFDWPGITGFETAGLQPGLYSVSCGPGQAAQHHPFVIEPEDLRDDGLVVLANTATWQAYNTSGGRSRYVLGPPKAASMRTRVLGLNLYLPHQVRMGLDRWRSDFDRPENAASLRLSSQRPMHNPSLGDSDWTEPCLDHLAGAEWRLLGWLESSGYQVDLVAEVNVAARYDQLRRAKTIVTSTHSEYWAREDWKALERLVVEDGVNLLNVSGNSLYAEIETFADGSVRVVSDTIERQVGADAAPSRLTGVRTNTRNFNTVAALTVSDAAHPLWVAAPPKFVGHESLVRDLPSYRAGSVCGNHPSNGQSRLVGRGASGWEVDVRVGAPGFELLASGRNRLGGADVVARPTSGSQGAVLSIPSITAAGSLSLDPHLGALVTNFIDNGYRTAGQAS